MRIKYIIVTMLALTVFFVGIRAINKAERATRKSAHEIGEKTAKKAESIRHTLEADARGLAQRAKR
ncbi:hypothetical protein [Glaciibacter psychrotolerans]|uniref:Uncharacterized protein n=1 Tax=Glaciibacter psychrotolerans TaxID=670054 RepID=A0A7Z0EC73_9MICO|nr:hypothetical protein [Leifsonia psychrotolerans]NYJ18242.1 hypothetical protein [Leifsonia psychrotolerans]